MGGSAAEGGWWRKIISLVEGSEGTWFRENLVLNLGEGIEVAFWDGVWAGASMVKDLFPRLYHLSSRKDGVVREMGDWVNGRWMWKLEWRRELLEREKAREEELLQFLSGFSPIAGAADRWSWGTNANISFSVKDAYKILCARSCRPSTQRPDVESLKCIWKASATMKAKVIASLEGKGGGEGCVDCGCVRSGLFGDGEMTRSSPINRGI